MNTRKFDATNNTLGAYYWRTHKVTNTKQNIMYLTATTSEGGARRCNPQKELQQTNIHPKELHKSIRAVAQ
jgi:hypothetical protein